MGYNVKANSATITNGRDRAAARAMLKAAGYSDGDLAKPIVGIANTWIETMPCNLQLAAARRARQARRARRRRDAYGVQYDRDLATASRWGPKG